MIKIVTDEDLHEMSAWVTPNCQDEHCSDCDDIKRAIKTGDVRQFRRLMNCPEEETEGAISTCKRCLWFWIDEVEGLDEERPLTLKELRAMDGGPVWVEFPKCPEASSWMLVDANRHCVYVGFLGDCDFENCGNTWLAYRRKPKPQSGKES